jgi:hypothetical protein
MINSEALELNIRLELTASKERGEDCFCCTYSLAELILEYIEQTKENKTMKYFKIGYGCGCGDNEDYIIATDQKEADAIAYESAIEDYESYEGLHGIRGMAEIAEEDFELELDQLEYSTGDYIAIEEAYLEERESQLDYWADEITEKEYLIGIGELEDDDE